MNNNVSIREAAELLGKCEQFVRLGLQQGAFDFGVAVLSKNGKKYSYQISRRKLEAYAGIEHPDELCDENKAV